jgi:diguanylate cyclase (GGDEF)-like protein
LPRPLLALWSVVTCGYLAWVVSRASAFHFRLADIAMFAALLACGAFSVEMARRAGEPSGVVKDVYAVWELPVVFLLPGLYALIVPAIRLTLTQWRVRRAPVYKRVYTVAAIGTAYGCARLVYVGLLPASGSPRAYLWSHTTMWLIAAGSGAVTQWVINQGLILAAFRLENASASIKDGLFSKEMLHNDATELCAALLVAVGMTISDLTLIIALPLATLLQRSFRHAQLLNDARADSKTGLLNAATWDREAGAEVARAIRTSSPLAVALLDLDRFKQINDTYGHLVGDEVLRGIAGTMTAVLREYDLAGRFGGEEFVMLLPQTRATDAFRIAERVRAHIARLPIVTSTGDQVQVTVSIGVAALDAGSSRELTELLAAADAALYRAKASGRDQVQMISTSRGLSAVRPAHAPSAEPAEPRQDAPSKPPARTDPPVLASSAAGALRADDAAFAAGVVRADGVVRAGDAAFASGAMRAGGAGSADSTGPAGRGALSGRAHVSRARQLPVDVAAGAEGADSSATTSALAM